MTRFRINNPFSARAVLLLALLVLGQSAIGENSLAVPSGQQVVLHEVLLDETGGGNWVRFRFIAPQIGRDAGDISYEQAVLDIETLCRQLVLPYLKDYALDADRVVISLSDRDVPFGESDAEATQFFEAYRPDGADCIWEEF